MKDIPGEIQRVRQLQKENTQVHVHVDVQEADILIFGSVTYMYKCTFNCTVKSTVYLQ